MIWINRPWMPTNSGDGIPDSHRSPRRFEPPLRSQNGPTPGAMDLRIDRKQIGVNGYRHHKRMFFADDSPLRYMMRIVHDILATSAPFLRRVFGVFLGTILKQVYCSRNFPEFPTLAPFFGVFRTFFNFYSTLIDELTRGGLVF